jgi:GNAT superfamily N-acetyltransferase
MTIRDATEADVDEIGALIRELADYEGLAHEIEWDIDQLGTALFGPEAVTGVLIAEASDRRVVGFALWFPTFSTFLGRAGIWLEDLFVRPEHRGAGHGRALLAELRSMTDGRVEWAVLDWNTSAVEFYDSLGARPVDGWTRYRWL